MTLLKAVTAGESPPMRKLGPARGTINDRHLALDIRAR